MRFSLNPTASQNPYDPTVEAFASGRKLTYSPKAGVEIDSAPISGMNANHIGLLRQVAAGLGFLRNKMEILEEFNTKTGRQHTLRSDAFIGYYASILIAAIRRTMENLHANRGSQH